MLHPAMLIGCDKINRLGEIRKAEQKHLASLRQANRGRRNKVIRGNAMLLLSHMSECTNHE